MEYAANDLNKDGLTDAIDAYLLAINDDADPVDAVLARVKVYLNVYSNLIRIAVAINLIEGRVFTKNTNFRVDGWESHRPYPIGIRRGLKYIERGTTGMNVVVGNEN